MAKNFERLTTAAFDAPLQARLFVDATQSHVTGDVRLRSQVMTETERDDERKKREDLQKNIQTFLDTVMEIAQGDLSRTITVGASSGSGAMSAA